jgi:hypothetical protein
MTEGTFCRAEICIPAQLCIYREKGMIILEAGSVQWELKKGQAEALAYEIGDYMLGMEGNSAEFDVWEYSDTETAITHMGKTIIIDNYYAELLMGELTREESE